MHRGGGPSVYAATSSALQGRRVLGTDPPGSPSYLSWLTIGILGPHRYVASYAAMVRLMAVAGKLHEASVVELVEAARDSRIALTAADPYVRGGLAVRPTRFGRKDLLSNAVGVLRRAVQYERGFRLRPGVIN